jgi:hypothetical protein
MRVKPHGGLTMNKSDIRHFFEIMWRLIDKRTRKYFRSVCGVSFRGVMMGVAFNLHQKR